MGTTAQKLTYLAETKTKLKNTINYTGAGIDSNTTFRNYPKKLYDSYIDILNNGTDSLYNNIPKVSGTGTSITLNGTVSAKMQASLAPSELSQASTPTPSDPQTVHTITGNNTIKIEGKNLFDENAITLSTYINSLGETGTSSVSNLSDYIPVKANQTYTFSYNYSTLLNSTDRNYCLYDSNKIFIIGDSYQPTNKKTIITPNNDGYIRIAYDKNCYDIMFNIGTTAPLNLGTEEYGKIGNYADDFIKTKGTNLLPFYNGSVTDRNRTYKLNYGNVLITGTSNDERTINVIDGSTTRYAGNITLSQSNSVLLQAGTYTISYVINNPSGTLAPNLVYGNLGDTGSNLTRINISEYSSYTFTLESAKYVTLALYDYHGTYAVCTVTECRINKGEDALPFEPYGTDEWWLKKNINKITLNGSENWTQTGTQASVFYISTVNDYRTSNNIPVNNYFKGENNVNDPTALVNLGNNNIAFLTSHINERLYINSNLFESANALKTWLSTHNTIIYYVPLIPTYITLNGTIVDQLETIYNNLLSYEGQTNISQTNADLPFIITANGIKTYENI